MLRGVVTAIVVALAVAGAALAGDPSKERIARTPAGNAQAKAEVLRRADVGSGWKGGLKKPDLSNASVCSSYHPRQSDLVLIGAAETTLDGPGIEIDTEAQVLRTAAMVRRDWQRSVLAPQVVTCLREGFAKSLGSKAKLVSFRRSPFSRVATFTNAFRLVANVETQGGPVPVEVDLVAIGSGRTELTLSITGPVAARTVLHATEVRFARLLAGRMRP